MIICFECSPQTKETLDKLITDGKYRDYSEVIEVAVANMSVLAGLIQATGSMVFEEPKQDAQDSTSARIDEQPSDSSNDHTTRNSIVHSRSRAAPRGDLQPTEATAIDTILQPDPMEGVPTIFAMEGIPTSRPQLAYPPSDMWAKGQRVPLDRWLFGQYNKLLPAKANSRAIAHLLKEYPKGVPISVAVSYIPQQAALLGKFLSYLDLLHNLGRDESLSTAFPSPRDTTEKGLSRYANQFVANLNSNGRLSGLLFELKLINYTRKGPPTLQLTEVGWRLASLYNPVLDRDPEPPIGKFSQEEIEFLLEHIARSVPVEDYAYRTILRAISDGANTPETLDTSLQQNESRDKLLTASFLSSQRSGAVSRMADLELVMRVRDGTRVTYEVTAKGEEYLTKPI